MSDFDHDPVKDLFDNERENIVPQHGNDLHWQSIVRQARVRRRSRFLGYGVGLTAAALVIGGVAYGAFLHNDTALVPAATKSTEHGRATETPPSKTATSAPTPATAPIPPPVSRPPATTPVPTKPAAPTPVTEIVVLRPVTASGDPAPGYTVTDETTSTITCVPPPGPSKVAVDGNILACSPAAAYAVACWKDPTPSMAVCFNDPWTKKLARVRLEGSFPTVTARPQVDPLGLLLSNGEHCRIRNGGAWSALEGHPGWSGTYACSNGKVLWGNGGSSGVNRSSPRWTVEQTPATGIGQLSTLRVVQAYFVGTQGG
jgi:hypothetical protein